MPKPFQTMGRPDPDAVHVRGHDLSQDLIGSVGFTDLFHLEILGTLPSSAHRAVLDAVLVAMTEHGMTATAVVARLTDLGAPGAIQGAVAAGLLGAGDRFLGAVDGTARLLQEWPETAGAAEDEEYAVALVARLKAEGTRVPGLGHPTHVDGDPRTPALYAVADREGVSGPARARLELLRGAAEAASGRRLPINVDGAAGALLTEIGVPWQVARGVALVARAAGLVGHLWDERRHPAAWAMWEAAESAAPYDASGLQ